MKIYHEKLGNCRIIIEANDSGKCFKLVEATKIKKVICKTYSWDTEVKWNTTKIIHHYMLWGNTQDENQMGVLHIASPKGRAIKSKRATRLFFEAIKAAREMTFKK